MRWFDVLAASIFIGLTALMLGTAAKATKQAADLQMAEIRAREAREKTQPVPAVPMTAAPRDAEIPPGARITSKPRTQFQFRAANL